MIRFVNEYWATVWDRDALVGDRVRGVVFLLLLGSLFAFFIGGLASRTQAWGVKELKSPDTDESATSPSVSARLARFIRAASVLSAVTSAATQLLRVGPPPNIETRTTPLTKIRGINAQIEERLAEEGIDNVETLATVEPYRLHRDTSFDLGTIIWWIDEALLLMYVPQRWQLLEEQGITGAIDLADLESRVEPDSPNNADGGIVSAPSSPAAAVASLNPGASSLAGTPPVDAIDALANRINMTRPEFRALIRRVRADRHVNYIWWIYNANGSNGDSDPPLV